MSAAAWISAKKAMLPQRVLRRGRYFFKGRSAGSGRASCGFDITGLGTASAGFDIKSDGLAFFQSVEARRNLAAVDENLPAVRIQNEPEPPILDQFFDLSGMHHGLLVMGGVQTRVVEGGKDAPAGGRERVRIRRDDG